jgi:hypothetical protein
VARITQSEATRHVERGRHIEERRLALLVVLEDRPDSDRARALEAANKGPRVRESGPSSQRHLLEVALQLSPLALLRFWREVAKELGLRDDDTVLLASLELIVSAEQKLQARVALR